MRQVRNIYIDYTLHNLDIPIAIKTSTNAMAYFQSGENFRGNKKQLNTAFNIPKKRRQLFNNINITLY